MLGQVLKDSCHDGTVFLEQSYGPVAVAAQQSPDALAAACLSRAASMVVVYGQPLPERIPLRANSADIALRKKQLEMDALKTAAQIKQQNNREHANMQIDALKTAAQLRQDQVENERSHAMDAVKHATTLAQQEAMADKGHAVDLHKHNMQMKAMQNKPKPKGE